MSKKFTGYYDRKNDVHYTSESGWGNRKRCRQYEAQGFMWIYCLEADDAGQARRMYEMMLEARHEDPSELITKDDIRRVISERVQKGASKLAEGVMNSSRSSGDGDR